MFLDRGKNVQEGIDPFARNCAANVQQQGIDIGLAEHLARFDIGMNIRFMRVDLVYSNRNHHRPDLRKQFMMHQIASSGIAIA